jgi:hypothetical protein
MNFRIKSVRAISDAVSCPKVVESCPVIRKFIVVIA